MALPLYCNAARSGKRSEVRDQKSGSKWLFIRIGEHWNRPLATKRRFRRPYFGLSQSLAAAKTGLPANSGRHGGSAQSRGFADAAAARRFAMEFHALGYAWCR